MLGTSKNVSGLTQHPVGGSSWEPLAWSVLSYPSPSAFGRELEILPLGPGAEA